MPKRKKKKHSKFDIRHKETLTLFLREYFELFFPDLAKRMNFETAIFLDKEMVALFEEKQNADGGKDQHRITDALVLIEILLNEGPEHILIHWEQESEKEADFEERMFHYFCGIYFKFRKPVFPIAMFTDMANWRKPIKDTFRLSLLQYPISEFSYRLIKLKKYKAEEFEKRMEDNPLAAAYLPLTDYPKKERPAIKAKAMKGISKMPQGQRRATLFSLIQESAKLTGEEEKQFQEIVQSDPLYQEVKMLQSIEEVGYERGFEQGLKMTAKNLLESGKLTKEEIAGVTGMKLSEVREIAKALSQAKPGDKKELH